MSKWMDWRFLAVWGLGVEIYHHHNVYMYAQGGVCLCVYWNIEISTRNLQI